MCTPEERRAPREDEELLSTPLGSPWKKSRRAGRARGGVITRSQALDMLERVEGAEGSRSPLSHAGFVVFADVSAPMGDGAGRCATSPGAYLGVGRYFPLPFPPRGPRRSGPCGKRGGTSDEARSSGGGRRRSGRFTSRATRRDSGFVPGFPLAGELFVRRYAHPDPIRPDAPQKSGSASTEESRTVRCIPTVVELPPRLIGPVRAPLRARHRQVVHRVSVAPSRIARHAAPARLRLVIVSAL